MKKSIFAIISIIIIVIFTISSSANIAIDQSRVNTFISEVPISANLQIGNQNNPYIVSLGTITPNTPYTMYEDGTIDTWTEQLTINKQDFPTIGNVILTTATFYSDTILIDLMYDNLTYQSDYTADIELNFTSQGVNYDTLVFVLESGTQPQVYFAKNGVYTLAFDDPEFYYTSITVDNMSETELKSALGVYQDAFEFEEVTESIQPTVPSPLSILYNYELITINSEYYDMAMKNIIKPNASTLYYTEGFYQFRPTLFGNGFVIHKDTFTSPVINIGSKTARVNQNITYGYYYRGVNGGIFYSTETLTNLTNTSATGRVDIIPSRDTLINRIPPEKSDILPYILIESYTTEISIRRFNIGDTVTVENKQVQLDTAGVPMTSTDFSHWIHQLHYPLFNNNASTGGDFGSLGGFLSASVGSFFNTPLFGGITIGSIVLIMVGLCIIFAVLKYFVGG